MRSWRDGTDPTAVVARIPIHSAQSVDPRRVSRWTALTTRHISCSDQRRDASDRTSRLASIEVTRSREASTSVTLSSAAIVARTSVW